MKKILLVIVFLFAVLCVTFWGNNNALGSDRFEATDLEDITPIYSFHDDDSMQKDEVIGSLDEALLFCTNYKAK